MSATTIFASPYQAKKTLDGVLKAALPVKRPLWVSSYVTDAGTVDKDTINFDVDLATKNVIGHFWGAEVDAVPLKHQGYGHVEMYLGYSKEAVHLTVDYDTLNVRRMGDDLGVVNLIQNQKDRLREDFIKAEQRFENLFEYVAKDIWLYGGYVAESEAHPQIVYNFNREVISSPGVLFDTSTSAAPFYPYKDVLAPSVNLTTSTVTAPWGGTLMPVLSTTGSYTAGDKVWSKVNIDSGKATPWKDVQKMVQTCDEWDRAVGIRMDSSAYEMLAYDIEKNYKDAAYMENWVIQQIQRDVLPRIETFEGLTYKRSIPVGDAGATLPIYIYKAVYHTRDTGIRTPYFPDGFVNIIPASSIQKKYGRIKHPKALWAPMPRWINFWKNEKAGTEEYEIHTAFAMAHPIINSVVCWKVM